MEASDVFGVQVASPRKVYRDVVAVDVVAFEVERGSVFCIIGPNGAGKTTAIECLEALRQPDGGSVLVAGPDPTADCARFVHKISVQLQVAGIPPRMKAWEALRLFAALYETSIPLSELSGELGLDGTLSKTVRLPFGRSETSLVVEKKGGSVPGMRRGNRGRGLPQFTRPALAGKVIAGDALYAEWKLSRYAVEQGGDYFWVVKDNQPTLKEEISLLFAEPPWGEEFPEARQSGRHGDRQEERWLRTATVLKDYFEWPKAGQVCCLERTRTVKGIRPGERSYAVTSLPRVDRGSSSRAGLTQVSVGR